MIRFYLDIRADFMENDNINLETVVLVTKNNERYIVCSSGNPVRYFDSESLWRRYGNVSADSIDLRKLETGKEYGYPTFDWPDEDEIFTILEDTISIEISLSNFVDENHMFCEPKDKTAEITVRFSKKKDEYIEKVFTEKDCSIRFTEGWIDIEKPLGETYKKIREKQKSFMQFNPEELSSCFYTNQEIIEMLVSMLKARGNDDTDRFIFQLLHDIIIRMMKIERRLEYAR